MSPFFHHVTHKILALHGSFYPKNDRGHPFPHFVSIFRDLGSSKYCKYVPKYLYYHEHYSPISHSMII